jgi:hypothetical protein
VLRTKAASGELVVLKITICGSMASAAKLVEIYNKLKKMGHEPLVHENLFGVADGTADEVKLYPNEHHKVKIKYDYIKVWHKLILSSDAILVCNFDKNGVKNYVGGNTLMEMGFAHVDNKKIFLLNPVPDIGYKDEILAMKPVILNGDLKKIK